MEFIKKITRNKEEQILLSDIYSKALISRNKNVYTNSRFLTPHEQALVQKLVIEGGINNCEFIGGTENDERQVCVFIPDYPMKFSPISAIRVTKSDKDELSHRDYLGSLMGLGIKRDCIGDIHVHSNGADIVVLASIIDFLLIEYKKAGRKTLMITEISLGEIIAAMDNSKVVRDTLSSLRLDSFVSAAFKISRSKSSELINNGKVAINHCECLKVDKEVRVSDKISVRGLGKVKLLNVIGMSKKNRYVIELELNR